MLRGAGKTSWELRVLDEDLESFFDERGPMLRGTEVRIDPERVTLRRPSGLASLLSLREPLSLSGKLKLNEKKEVVLELEHLQSFGIAPGKPLMRTALSLINPILTSGDINRKLRSISAEPLRHVSLSTRFEELCMETGHMYVCGEITAKPVSMTNRTKNEKT